MTEKSRAPEAKGLPIVLSAPSGGGKSTIAAEVIKRSTSAVKSISCTTRAPRPGEKEGVDYFFVSDKDFRAKIERGGFLEWAEVHGSLYGTPIDAFEEKLKKGFDVILAIDPQGAVSIRKLYPAGVFVFVVPPSWSVLAQRLEGRASDDQNSIQRRLSDARKELLSLQHYDYLVLNDDLDAAVADVAAIIRAEHRRLVRINKKEISFLNLERT